MRCPKCGNEVGPQEAFCGQCGTPNMPPARPTEMVNTPSPRSGLLSGYNTNMPSSSYPYSAATSSPSAGALPPPQQQVWPSGPQQQSEFYQQPTEAISAPSPNNGPVYPAGYPQPGFVPGQYNSQIQAFQTGSHPGTGYQQPPSFPSGQGYGYPGTFPRLTPPPPKQRSGILVFASVCLIVALLVVMVFGALYLFRDRSPRIQTAPTATPTSAPTATVAPSPSPSADASPTATDTPTPTASATPTVAPTPTPDPGFVFCQICTSNGFLVEYPQTWQQGTTSDGTGVIFTNPSPQDQYAAFKTPGATSQTANDLVNADLQNNFSKKPDYVPPATLSTTTIGGETWAYAVAHYQSPSNMQERIEVFGTVHQGKAYIIELQAAENDFANVNTQYFEKMLGNFQFVQSTP